MEVTEGSSEGVGTTSIRPCAAPATEFTGTVSPSTTSDGYIPRVVAFCAICFENDLEDRMLPCPGCHRTYHYECWILYIMRFGEWFCPMCVSTNTVYNLQSTISPAR
jgi:hypothetical protein